MAKNEYGEAVIKWITVTVLIAVSLFFVILYKNVFINKPEGLTEEKPQVSSTPDNNEEENDEEEDDEEIIPVIRYSVFPRQADTSAGGEFSANTGGISTDKLKDVYDVGNDFYLILETDSNGDDYKADRENLAVAKVSAEGTVLSTVTLLSSRNEKYLASKLSPSGILIAASGVNGITYYLVKYNLSYDKCVTADNFTEIKMHSAFDYVLVAGVKDKYLHLKAYDDSLVNQFYTTVEFEGKLNLVDILPTISGHSIYVNVAKESPCAYITNFSQKGDFQSKSVISDGKLLKIVPTNKGYTMLEKSGGTLYLKAVDFARKQLFRTMIGEGSGGDFYPLPNGYIAFIYGQDTLSKHLCSYGDIITVNENDFKNILSINSYAEGIDCIYFYADVKNSLGGKDTAIINYTSNNIVNYSKIIGGNYSEQANSIVIKDDLLITFLTSNSSNSTFGKSFGSFDVFIIGSKIA